MAECTAILAPKGGLRQGSCSASFYRASRVHLKNLIFFSCPLVYLDNKSYPIVASCLLSFLVLRTNTDFQEMKYRRSGSFDFRRSEKQQYSPEKLLYLATYTLQSRGLLSEHIPFLQTPRIVFSTMIDCQNTISSPSTNHSARFETDPHQQAFVRTL